MTTTDSTVLKPSSPSKPAELQTTDMFFNRESTWLEFNRRVLAEAADDRTPLLERLGFLAIFNSNLDEFIQKRVGGFKHQIDAGVTTRTPDGKSAQELLADIRETVLPMLAEQARLYTNVLLPKLAEEGIFICKWSDLSEDEQAWCTDYYRKNVYPALTPLAVDPGHPFPFISNLSTSLGVMLRAPKQVKPGLFEDDDSETRETQFARVKVPDTVLTEWIQVQHNDGKTKYKFISLTDLIAHNLADLFEGMEIVDVEPFRITRNASVAIGDEDSEDLLTLVNQQLRDRRFAQAVRLEVDNSASRPMNQFLINELGLTMDDVYEMPALLDYTGLWAIHSLNLPRLKHRSWKPTTHPRLIDEDASIFNVIRTGDVLLHHPYESFSGSVERFIADAADDPRVVAIKMTLYRTSKDSPFIESLIKAAEAGKQVAVLVELKARFDEARNVQIARLMKAAGVHVAYGIPGLKTHTKTAMVVRREADGMRVYSHVGTGNYNEKTAGLYTDLGILTCDPRLTHDLVSLFHFLTGRSAKRDFDHLLIAPINMRRRFLEMIEREIAHTVEWKNRGGDENDPSRPTIQAKMNQLEDMKIVGKLYEASQAGVKIDLIVRGFCCLKPGVPGLSKNISVVSVIGRFLEHSRIFKFHNNGNPDYFIGSADWMYRNLSARVEAITPIYEPHHQQRLQQILDVLLSDQRQAWDMQPDGKYIQRMPSENTHGLHAMGTHERTMRQALDATSVGALDDGALPL